MERNELLAENRRHEYNFFFFLFSKVGRAGYMWHGAETEGRKLLTKYLTCDEWLVFFFFLLLLLAAARPFTCGMMGENG